MVAAATPTSAAQQAQSAITNFLTVAPRKYWAVLGTVPSGNAGGATAVVAWQQQIPIVPAFCTAIENEITLPVNAALGATTGSLTLSQFAPYSAVGNQLTLGGAPPWPLTEFTPWYLDNITRSQEYDPQFPGLGNNAQYFGTITDQGPQANQIGGSGSLNPGTTITNVTGSLTNTTYTFQYNLRQNLQRKRHLLWGAVPMGDPENRPNNFTQIFPLLGNLPEQTMFVLPAGVNTAVTTQAQATVNATYELAYIDLLPPGMTSAPNPMVNYGLQLNQFSTSGLNAGTIYPITHRTAMLYTAIHQLLINAQLPIRADYFSLWDDQDQQSARWSYDAQNNTFVQWFRNMQRIYRRFFNTGHYFANLESGDFPDIPTVTPYDALMSPDATYAAAFGVPVTPAMSTALRIPTGTTINAAYIRTYSFGLVRVPY